MSAQLEKNPYYDETGRPILRESVTALIDLLGFSQSIMAAQTREESQSLLEKVVDAINDSRSFVNRAFSDEELDNVNRSATKFFSDNLIFSVPYDDDRVECKRATMTIIRCAQRYQLRMALHGLFARGALASGLICLTDEVIFGSALIETYQLESKAAMVPRVIVAEQLSNLMLDYYQQADSSKEDRLDLMCQDIDGWWFVNYLDAARTAEGIRWDYIEKHKKRLLESLSSTPRHDVLPKFDWVSRYHNVFCHWHRDHDGYRDDYRLQRIDENSAIDRICDVAS